MLLWEAYRKSPLGYSETPTSPLSPNWGLTTLVKTCIANCGQAVLDTTVVFIDSLWEHTITLPNSTIVDPLEAPLPEKGSSQKIKLLTAIGCQGKLSPRASYAL